MKIALRAFLAIAFTGPGPGDDITEDKTYGHCQRDQDYLRYDDLPEQQSECDYLRVLGKDYKKEANDDCQGNGFNVHQQFPPRVYLALFWTTNIS